jgi:uncharacterized metal-binding protein
MVPAPFIAQHIITLCSGWAMLFADADSAMLPSGIVSRRVLTHCPVVNDQT